MTERGALPINDIAMFVAVAQNAGFTRAAVHLGTSKSAIGKAVQRLEARLGTKLLQRTTRAVRLTEDGELYLEAARAALEGLNEAESAMAARKANPAGRVRLDIPVGFGRVLLPSFSAIRQRYPLVSLDVSLSDRASDPVGDGWDIVLRIGALPPKGSITVRKLCELQLGLYASPAYLADHPPITTLSDLSEHEAIVFRGASGRLRSWTVNDKGALAEVVPKPGLIFSDGRALVQAAIARLGVAQIFDRVASPHVAAKDLSHVLPAADAPGPPLYALLPLGRRMPPKTKVVLEQLAADLKAQARAPVPTPVGRPMTSNS